MYPELKDIYHIYQAETVRFDDKKKEAPLWFILFQASGIFMTVTLIVFSVANYQLIRSQIIDWKQGRTTVGPEYISDADNDGLPDWWEKQYSLDSTNFEDRAFDTDSDSVSNILEFRFGTDPNDPDSDRDGFFDGEEIEKGFNPNGMGKADVDNDGMPDWFEQKYGLNKEDTKDANADFDKDGVINLTEFLHQTDPLNKDTDNDGILDSAEDERMIVSAKNQSVKASDQDNDGLTDNQENYFGTDPNLMDTDGDGFNDFQELSRGYDPMTEGLIKAQIEIPSINVLAPLVWALDPSEDKLQADLKKGLIHYPSSAFPGLLGNSYITGHSSYYPWSNNPFKEALKDIGKIKVGDEVIIHLKLANAKKVDIVYKINSTQVVDARDGRLFREYEGAELTLVSCWPIGTDWKRIMLKGNLIRPSF